jgi:predicted transcriptional regulator
MKIAISIPDQLFEAADRLAERLGMSRSQLYATAVAEFVEERKAEGVTECLDDIYAAEAELSELDPVLNALQIQALPKEDW